MGLAGKLSKGSVLKTTAHVSEIRPNELNHYHIDNEEIIALAETIKRDGQLENGLVYIDEESEDGKKYTLIGGERRWRALTYLFENGLKDGMYDIVVLPKPKNIVEEKRLIRNANRQRVKTEEDVYLEIIDAEKEYDYLCEIGQQPKGKKRDFIGNEIGRSGKTVDNIKKKFNGVAEDGRPIKVDEPKKKRTGKNDFTDLRVRIEKIYQCRVKVTEKSIQFSCENTEQLNELFEKIGLQSKLDD